MTDPLAESCCTTASDTPYLELEPCPVRDAGLTKKKKLRLPDAGENEQTSGGGSDHQRSRNLIVSFLLMIVIGSGNKVFMKLQTIPMANYPLFLNLLTTFMFIPLSFAYIIPVARFGLFNNAITPDQLSMPKKPFAVMGALDCLAGIMQTFASVYLPGPLLILLPQAAIPISMALSRRILREKYKCLQYVGAAVVMAGILVVLEPVITRRHAPSYVCAAFDEEKYCSTCQTETTEDTCLSHRIDDPDRGGLFSLFGNTSSNSTDNMDDEDLVCHWIPATESQSHMANAISTLIWSLGEASVVNRRIFLVSANSFNIIRSDPGPRYHWKSTRSPLHSVLWTNKLSGWDNPRAFFLDTSLKIWISTSCALIINFLSFLSKISTSCGPLLRPDDAQLNL